MSDLLDLEAEFTTRLAIDIVATQQEALLAFIAVHGRQPSFMWTENSGDLLKQKWTTHAADKLPDPRPLTYMDLRPIPQPVPTIVVTICEGDVEDTLVLPSMEYAHGFAKAFTMAAGLFSGSAFIFIDGDIDSELELADEEPELIAEVEALFASKRAELRLADGADVTLKSDTPRVVANGEEL